MKILILHNRYRQPGGEDAVVRSETAMLRDYGVEVVEAIFDNDGFSLREGLASAWSAASYRKVLALCREHRPDVAHVHNFWTRLSPSVHAACRAAGVPTVQTLHNFRLLCASADFLRDGKPCEDCLCRSPWLGAARRCYRGSAIASAAVARMIVASRRRGVWERDVGAFIALSEFSRAKFIEGGLPAARLHVKPNFVEDPGPPVDVPSSSGTILYAGRLAASKGVASLLAAWSAAKLGRLGRLLIMGDGPDRAALQACAPDAVFTGQVDSAEVLRLMGTVRALVLPSLAEQFPRTIVEAFAQGRPAIVCDRGPMPEIVRHGQTGLTFRAAEPASLGAAMETLLSSNGLVDRLGRNARAEYVGRYTPQRNFELLMDIYRAAIHPPCPPYKAQLTLISSRS